MISRSITLVLLLFCASEYGQEYVAKHTKVIKNTVSSAHVKDANFPHNVHEHMNTHTYKHSKHTRTHTYTYTYALVGIVPLNLVAAA